MSDRPADRPTGRPTDRPMVTGRFSCVFPLFQMFLAVWFSFLCCFPCFPDYPCLSGNPCKTCRYVVFRCFPSFSSRKTCIFVCFRSFQGFALFSVFSEVSWFSIAFAASQSKREKGRKPHQSEANSSQRQESISSACISAISISTHTHTSDRMAQSIKNTQSIATVQQILPSILYVAG